MFKLSNVCHQNVWSWGPGEWVGVGHGLINYIDTKAKCRHLKKFTCGQMCIRVYRLERQSVMLVFSTQLCELLYCPSNLLSVQLSPPLPPFPVSKYSIYRQCIAGRGWGLLNPVGDHILVKFNTLYLTRFRTYKIARPSQTKTQKGRGGGLRETNTCR